MPQLKRFSFRHVLQLLFLCFALSGSYSVFSIELDSEDEDWIANNPKVKVALLGNHYPYTFINDNGQFSGIVVDYLNLVSTKLGIEIETIPVKNITQAYSDLENEIIDIYATTTEHPSNIGTMLFSTPYLPYRYSFYGIKGISSNLSLNVTNVDSIAVVGNTAIAQILETGPFKDKLVNYDNEVQAITALKEREVSLYVGEEISTQRLLADLQFSTLKDIAPLALDKDIYLQFGMHNSQTHLLSLVNKALEDISDETKNDIQYEWTKSSSDKITLHGLSTHTRAPYMYGQNTNIGLEQAIVHQTFNNMGFSSDGLQNYSSATAKEIHFNNPGLDFSIGHVDKEEGLFYSEPYLLLKFGLASNTNNETDVFTKDNATVVYIASSKDKAMSRAIDKYQKLYPNLKFIPFSTLDDLLESQLRHKYDAIFTEHTQFLWHKNKLTDSLIHNYQFKNENIVEIPLYVAFNDERLKNRFNASLKLFKPSVHYQRVVSNYASIDYTLTIKRANLLSNILAYFIKNKSQFEAENILNLFYHKNDISGIVVNVRDSNRSYTFVPKFDKFTRTSNIVSHGKSVVSRDLIYRDGSDQSNVGHIEIYKKIDDSQDLKNTYIPPLSSFVSYEQSVLDYIQLQYKQLGLNQSSLNLSLRETEWLDNNPVVTVAVDPSALPYEAYSGEEFIGIIADYLTLLSEKLGIDFQPVKTSSWDESLSLATKNKVSLVSAAYNNKVLDGQYLPSLPLFSDNLAIAMKDEKPNSTSFNLNQFASQKVGILSGGANTPKITQSYQEVDWVYIDSTTNGLDMLLSNKIVAMIDTGFVLNYLISKKGLSDLQVVGKIDYVISPTFHTLAEDPILSSIMAKAINSITQDDRNDIEFKWSPNVIISQINYKYLVIGTLFVVTFLTYMFYSNRKLRRQVEVTKKAEKIAETQRALLFEVLNKSPIAVAIIQKDFAIFTNTRALELFSISSSSITSYDVNKIYHDIDVTRQEVYQELSEQGSIIDKEIVFKKSNGDVFTGLTSYYQIDYHGAPAVLFWTYDVSEMKNLNVELDAAIVRANIASQAKSDFLANMSHEIRTPMNAIIGMSYLALKETMSSAAERYVTKVNQSAESLLTIINDILDISKVEARKLELESQPFLLSQFMRGVLDVLTIKTKEKGLFLYVQIEKKVPQYLYGDDLRLRQVLLNLAGNAVKFTKEGNITISIRLLDTLDGQVLVRFSVKDTGIGISQEHQQNLFESFHQADSSVTRKYGGTGLGLAISKQLVELMGGQIHLDSTLDKGSTFYFDIPISTDLKHSNEIPWFEVYAQSVSDYNVCYVPVHDSKSNELMIAALKDIKIEPVIADNLDFALVWLEKTRNERTILIVDESVCHLPEFLKLQSMIKQCDDCRIIVTVSDESLTTELLNSGVHVLTKPCLPIEIYETFINKVDSKSAIGINTNVESQLKLIANKNVLLVEDNEINQELAVALLSEYDLNVAIANNGKEAVDLVTENDFDIILMDIQMPVMGGYEATHSIRKLNINTPIIAMTANVMSGDAEKAYESGMQDYVSKPINIPHLERVLVNYLLHAGKVSDSINSMPTRHISVVEQVSSESFDSSLGLLNANSDDVLYRKILTKSIDSIPINIHDLDVAFQACDWKSAERFAHTIKGLAATIGAQKLSNSASYIEQTLSQLDSESDYYDNDSYNALSQQWTEAQAEIQAFLLDYVSNEKDPNAQKIDSKSTLSQDLTKLIEVLEEYDFDSKVLIEQIVSNHKNKSISPKLVELDQFIEAYDFDRALELAQSILDNGAH